MRYRVRGVAIVAAVVLAATAVGAQETGAPRSEAEVERVASRLDAELMSPFCQGLTLENCPTRGAAELRAEIRGWLREGRSEDWVLETLVERHGEGILGAPRFRGMGILAWILPGVVLLGAAIGVGVWLRGHLDDGPRECAELPDDESRRAAAARVERDMERLEVEP